MCSDSESNDASSEQPAYVKPSPIQPRQARTAFAHGRLERNGGSRCSKASKAIGTTVSDVDRFLDEGFFDELDKVARPA